MNLIQLIIIYIIIIIFILSSYLITNIIYRCRHKLKYSSLKLNQYENQPYQQHKYIKQINFNKKIIMRSLTSHQNSKYIQNNHKYNPEQLVKKNQHSQIEQKQKKKINHSFITKLAKYSIQGIQLYSISVSIIKLTKAFKNLQWVDDLKQTKSVEKVFYSVENEDFMDILQILKLEEKQYKCIAQITSIFIKQCYYQMDNYVGNLMKQSQYKVLLDQQYQKEVDKLQNFQDQL